MDSTRRCMVSSMGFQQQRLFNTFNQQLLRRSSPDCSVSSLACNCRPFKTALILITFRQCMLLLSVTYPYLVQEMRKTSSLKHITRAAHKASYRCPKFQTDFRSKSVTDLKAEDAQRHTVLCAHSENGWGLFVVVCCCC